MENIKISNMTPHQIRIIIPFDGEGIIKTKLETIKIFPSLGNIRLSQNTQSDGIFIDKLQGEIPLSRTKFGSCDLPEYDPEHYYIVSSLVCQAFPDRRDLLVPNELVRDKDGQIIGCKSLSINPFYVSY